MKWSKAKIRELCQRWRQNNIQPGCDCSICQDMRGVPDTLFVAQLINLGACGRAIFWVGNRTARQAWEDCDRLDWKYWLATNLGAVEDGTWKKFMECQPTFEQLRAASEGVTP